MPSSQDVCDSTNSLATIDAAALLSGSALRHLEPRPGGYWTVTAQSQDVISLAYVMDGGVEAAYYTFNACSTIEDVRTRCESLIYEYSDELIQDPPQYGSVRIPSSASAKSSNNSAIHHVLRPQEQVETSSIGVPTQRHDAVILSGNSPQIVFRTGAETHICSSAQPAPSLSQHSPYHSLQPPTPDHSQLQSSAEEEPGNVDWALTSRLFQEGGVTMTAENEPILEGNQGMHLDALYPSITWDGSWNHLTSANVNGGPPAWESMFPNP
ncbi:hypothetical protein G7046_g229 [Stylonectria norvegica]|nr:hypothetical protein G7046_g229 [Stylonectria norvegica]